MTIAQERKAQRQYNKDDCEQLIVLGEKIKVTLETNGWAEILRPLLDKMIIDVLGGKENGRWHNGSLDRAHNEERKEFLLGYKAALVNFHSAIYSYLDESETAKKTIVDLTKEEKVDWQVPMTEGDYA